MLISLIAPLILGISIVIVISRNNLIAQSWLLAFLGCLLIAELISIGGTFIMGGPNVDVANNLDSYLFISSVSSIFRACAWLFLLRFIMILKSTLKNGDR